MRDSLGGTFVLGIIIAFIVFALGYLAFNVNYTKAFRMKNKIISVYEDFDGKCNENMTKCNAAIDKFGNDIGYYSIGASPNCDGDYSEAGGQVKYCVKEILVNDKSNALGGYSTGTVKKKYYRIYTKIYIDIPIINRIFDFAIFHINGDTKTFKYE